MGATTRWRDTQTTDFNDVLNRLNKDIPDDERTASTYWVNFHNQKSFDNNVEIILNNEKVIFNMVHYRYEQMSVQDTQAEDRPITKS